MGSPREVLGRSYEVLGSDKWLPRKLKGKVTKVTQVTKVIKCIIDYKIDHLSGLKPD